MKTLLTHTNPKRFHQWSLVLFLALAISVTFGLAAAPVDSQTGSGGKEVAAQVETGQEPAGPTVSAGTFKVIRIILFILAFFLCAFVIMSPVYFPSMRSVGSPDEIIEAIGLGKENTDGKKVLVAYDTRHGTTATTAEKMGHMLAEKGCYVDVRCIRNIRDEDISEYDAYVVGSWILYFKVSVPTLEFIQRYKDLFVSKPTFYFIVCSKLTQDRTDKAYEEVRSYVGRVEEQFPEIKPSGVGLFPGGFVLSKLGFIEKVQILMKIYKAVPPRYKEGVFIDDELLDEFTTKVAATSS
jgi:menaquinone-dependent protoporphyrinogen IX oxidase